MKLPVRIVIRLWFVGSLLSAPVCLSAQIITTVAGSNAQGDGGVATAASISQPASVAVDARGNLYIADAGNHRIRKVAVNGTISTVAGNGTAGFSGDGGAATSAQLRSPAGVAVDRNGNLFIADQDNSNIRQVSATGIITTVAGNGFGEDGGAATSAALFSPTGVAVDGTGNFFIADVNNQRIRKVSTSGIITTVAGNGTAGFSGDSGVATSAQLNYPYGVVIDEGGSLYIADRINNRIRKVSAAGIITTVAGTGANDFSGDGGSALNAALAYPTQVAVDRAGNLYIADTGNQRIRKVSPAGIITTVAGNGSVGFGGDGGAATSAQLYYPTGVTIDEGGTLYIADATNNRVRKVSTAGIITTVAGNGTDYSAAGDGGVATRADLNTPTGVAVDGSGNIFIADLNNNRVRKVDATGMITTVAGTGNWGFSGDGGAASSAQLNSPYGVAVDRSGNLYIADHYNSRIRKVSATGVITTVAGNGSFGFSGDGGAATSAALNFPTGVAVDSDGNLFIADRDNDCIRKVVTTGIITTVSTNAGLYSPTGVAVDKSGNLFVADANNYRIRKIASTGVVTTVAGTDTSGFSGDGGVATSAQLSYPSGVAVDDNGVLFIADQENQRIRKVSAAGIITTIAGNGDPNFKGDGGVATSAAIAYPYGVAVDGDGNLFIADQDNNRIRKVISSIASVQNGDWSSTTTWNCNCIPTGSDRVTISAGHSVTVSQPVRARALRQQGRLVFTATGKVAF